MYSPFLYQLLTQTSLEGLIDNLFSFLSTTFEGEKVYFVQKISNTLKIIASQEKKQPILFREVDEYLADTLSQTEKKLLQLLTNLQASFQKNESTEGYYKLLPLPKIAIPISNAKQTIFLVISKEKEIDAATWQVFKELIPYIALSIQQIEERRNIIAQSNENMLALVNIQEELTIRDSALSQKSDEVFQAYQDLKLLSQIGQEIATHLTVESIIETAYDSINKLMDATIFDIGLYNRKENRLDFVAAIESDKKLPVHFYHLEKDTDRLAVWCFTHKDKVFVNDFMVDYQRYFPKQTPPPPTHGKRVGCLIYLPLLLKGKALGVITVQSYTPNVYTKYHLNILRNLALYVAIALENADAYHTLAQNSYEIEQQKEEIEIKNRSLAKQTEELQQSYNSMKLLGNIGKDISSSLSTFSIIEVVYENINNLMDAAVFCIGVYEPQNDTIIFQGGRELGKILKEFSILVQDDRLASWCFRHNKEILINDAQHEYTEYIGTEQKPMAGVQTESIIYLPLNDKVGQTIGVITVQSFKPNAYNQYHLDLLRNLAIYTGIALENALLYHSLEEKVMERTRQLVKQKEEVEKSYQNIQLLSQIGLDITTSLSTEKIIETVYENINKIMDAAAFAVGIINENTGKIEFRGGMEKGEKLPTFYHQLHDTQRFSVWTILNRKEVFVNNYLREYKRYIPELKAPEAGEDPESMIYLPLLSKDKIIGVITVQSFQRNAYTKRHLDILRNLALYIAIALENSETYSQIEAQKTEIEKTNQKITSSINYAQRIQQAILPEPKNFAALLPNSFVFFKPKDIVSGDFYWLESKNDKVFIAAVDCTGHGIPGAFMSLIGNEVLTEIVTMQDITSPDLILQTLHEKIRKSLRQAESENRDGMDLALCVLDQNNRRVEYAGAMNPLLYVRNNEIQMIKADKTSCGGIQREAERTFTKHIIEAEDTPTTFYIFSDGYQDQFGGGRKYGLPRMKELFLRIYTIPITEQAMEVEQEYITWRGTENPIDDILVIGFRW
jgi:transcriptional regulator with GAF, ATPase, and Fis domain